MKDKRPINLNLLTIQFPIPAIVSILHRISGVILFLLIPFFIWGLSASLQSPESYDQLIFFMAKPVVKFLIWLVLASLIYHIFAGIRHLFMDIGIGESLRGGRLGAQLILILSIVMIILTGVWLW